MVELATIIYGLIKFIEWVLKWCVRLFKKVLLFLWYVFYHDVYKKILRKKEERV